MPQLLQLSLLGTFVLTRDGAPVRLPKKAQALLAVLALTSAPVSKEVLATLLWGHTGTDQAKASLRQCLVSLRSALNEHVGLLQSDGPTLSLQDHRHFSVDARDFTRFAASDRLEDLQKAAALFRDVVLSGMVIPVDPFDRWLEVQRQRFDTARLELLQRLVGKLTVAGQYPRAIAISRQLVTLDPLYEEGHRQLMKLLAGAGNRGSALLQYEQCVEVLSDELGVTPDPRTVGLAEAIRKGITQVEETPSPNLVGAHVAPANEGIPKTSLPLPDKPSIAILPFAHLGNEKPDPQFFIRGLVDDIAVALGREAWLLVVSCPWGTASECEGLDVRSIGTDLGVKFVLKGSVRIEGDECLVVVQLLDASIGAHVWSGRFRDRMDKLFDVQERLTTKVAATIGPALISFEGERSRHQPTASLSAFELYLRALSRFRLSSNENLEALAHLDRALEFDPAYATAHALAARCYQFQLMFGWRLPGDKEFDVGVYHGHEAAKLGSNDSEALWMAGLALVHLSGELDHAQSLIERSLALNANSANAWTASCLLHSYLGSTDKAIEHFSRAQRLNPLDVSQHLHWNTVAWAYLGAGRIREAADAAEQTLRIQPDYPPGLRLKAVTYALLNRIEEARTCVGTLLIKQPSTSISWMKAFLSAPLAQNQKALETYLIGARLAGVPETA